MLRIEKHICKTLFTKTKSWCNILCKVQNYPVHASSVGLSVKESEGCVILLWIEKTPPIVTSPSWDRRGNSGRPCIWQRESGSQTALHENRRLIKIKTPSTEDMFILVFPFWEESHKSIWLLIKVADDKTLSFYHPIKKMWAAVAGTCHCVVVWEYCALIENT